MTEDQEPELTEDEEESIQQLIADYIELPAFILALAMLIILILEFAVDLQPSWRRILLTAGTVIWWLFILEYALRVFLAENRLRYVRTHLLDALFIVVPFLRVFRVVRALRAFRFMRVLPPATLARTYVITRRGLRRFGRILGRRSFGYVISATLVALFIGSLMIFLLERGAPGAVIVSYGGALWWTIGVLTTVGNELYPITAEGRIVAVILMVYGVGVFGYIAATLASYFVHADVSETDEAEERTDRERFAEISAKLDKLISMREPPESET